MALLRVFSGGASGPNAKPPPFSLLSLLASSAASMFLKASSNSSSGSSLGGRGLRASGRVRREASEERGV